MSKDYNTPFKDAIYKPATTDSDLEFEGKAEFASPEFNINGFKVVTVVGDGELDAFLKDPA